MTTRWTPGWLLGRTLRLAVPLYLSTLVLGLIPTSLAMVGLGLLAGDRPWRGDLLGPGWLNLVTELLMEAIYTRGAPGVSLLVVAGVIGLPVAMLAQLVAYSYLTGGILESLRPDADGRLSFWRACRLWFWPSLRLSMLGGALFVLLSGTLSVLVGLLGRWVGSEIVLMLQLAAQALVLGWLELARALLVVRSTRAVGRALAAAGGLALRPLPIMIWLLLALPSAGVLVAAMLPPSVTDPYSPLDVIVALAFGQGVAFLGAWTRVIRLAVALWLAQAAPARQPAPPVSVPSARL
jgi:hypothetical protein